MKNLPSLKSKITIIHESDHPKILVITPLRPTDSILESLKTNIIDYTNIEFDWISCSSKGNCPQNAQIGLEKWRKVHPNKFDDIDFIIKLDNDLGVPSDFLNKLYTVAMINKNNPNIGYFYPSLYYRGIQNLDFPAVPFNSQKLRQSNYITSMAMIKLDVLEKIGGFIYNKKYIRLADWALWLHMLNNGYVGCPVPDTFIVAPLEEHNISAGSQENYQRIYKNVYDDFIKAFSV